jgi:CRP-like cAMP-binding protein
MTLDEESLRLVGQTPLFVELAPAVLSWLLEEAQSTSHPDGGLLFSQGDVADRFFVVLAGRVHLFALTEGGDQSIIEVIDAGSSFAEGAIFANARFPLNAEAMSGTRLLEIPAGPFLRRLGERHGLTATLLGALARWQRRLMREIADLKGRSPVQRLGAYLLGLAGEGAGPAVAVVLPLSKSDLASRIGVAPESLSRAMHRLKPVGVTSRGREFSIADVAALKRFCGAE